MLDTKKIIQLGLGVAIGMIAWHFIQQQMNKSVLNGGATASASGDKTKTLPCRGNLTACEDYCTKPHFEGGLGGTYSGGYCTWSGNSSGYPLFGSAAISRQRITSSF